MAVTSILESGLRFEPPTDDWFRLEDCAGFKSLKGVGVHELDFSWFDRDRNILWLFELKDYSETGGASDPQKQQTVDYLDREFVDKAKDCLLVLGSVWHNLPKKALLEPDLPPVFRQLPSQDRRLKLAFVVKTDEPQRFSSSAGPLQDRLRSKIKGQCELLGIREHCEVFLFDHETAIKSGLPLRVDDTFRLARKQTQRKGKRSR